jgi:Rrf2 family protein
MQITRQADYALRTVLYLASLENGARASTAKIAKEQRIPPSFLAKIVSLLAIAGVVQTSRGARGGVALARLAGDISLLDVVQAIDGPIRLIHCIDDHGDCVFGDACSLQETLCEAQDTLVSSLAATDFASLATRQGVLSA